MAYALTAVVAAPDAAATHLLHRAEVYGVVEAKGRSTRIGAAVIEVGLRPLPALEAERYPIERVRIVVMPSAERVHVYPLNKPWRPFKHRNLVPTDLCLQYPADSPALQWLPADGLEALVTLVHRHLIFEETWRRTGRWPCEDAPHGDAERRAHPIITTKMRMELGRWRRS